MSAILLPYETVSTIEGIPLIIKGETGYKADPTLATGDVKISKDGGALANLATLPSAQPSAGRLLRVSISAAESTCKEAVIQFVDVAGDEWEEQIIRVETYGHASAKHPNIGRTTPTVQLADAVTHGGTTAQIVAKKVEVKNPDGDAAVFESTGANGRGLYCKGTGSYAGLHAMGTMGILVSGSGSLAGLICDSSNALAAGALFTGGANGSGVKMVGGATAGAGLHATANGGGDGAKFTAVGGANHDLNATVKALNGHTAQTGDSFARLGAPTGASIAADLVTIDGIVDTLVARLTDARAGYLDNLGIGENVAGTSEATAIAAALATVDGLIDTLIGRLTAARAGYLDNLSGHTAQTGDNYARIGAPAGASIAADLATIDGLADTLIARLTAARAGYLDNLSGHTAQTGDSYARLGEPAGASIAEDIAAIESGGGTNVILGAVVASRDPGNRIGSPVPLEMFALEDKQFNLTCLDASGAPVDLSGLTLRFLAQDTSEPPTAEFEINDEDITRSGDNNEVAALTVSASQSATAGELQWRLWKLAEGADGVLVHGTLLIKPSQKTAS